MAYKKLKGFTLIELIVVIAIIGILAAILVPSLVGYYRQARAMELVANARHVYNAIQMALAENVKDGEKNILPGEIYLGENSGTAVSQGSSDDLSVTKFLGDDFDGYYAIVVNADASGVECALWSDRFAITAEEARRCSMDQIEESVRTKEIGSYPTMSVNIE